MPEPRGRKRRNASAPAGGKKEWERYKAAAELQRLTQGMPEGLREALSVLGPDTGTADVRATLAAVLDLHDPRLIDVTKEVMLATGAMTSASAFNDTRRGIEEERRAYAAAYAKKKEERLGRIRIDDSDFADLTDYALRIIAECNANPTGPVIFRHGNGLVRLAEDPHTGARSVEPLDRDWLLAFLTRHGRWRVKKGEHETKGVRCPLDVALHILGDDAGWEGLPRLEGIITAPVFAASGDLIRRAGFHEPTGLFLAPPRGFMVPEVPVAPTKAQVEAARQAVVAIFADFPFQGVTKADLLDGAASPDLANFLAWTITPLIRPLLGPTALAPALYIGKSAYGVGASKLLTVAQLILTGTSDLRPALPKREDEQHKEIVAALASQRAFLCWDNATEVAGAPVAALTTTSIYSGRTLGRSETRSFRNRLGVAITGVNVSFSKEMQRRVVMTWLDSGDVDPHQRDPKSFAHQNLEAHVLRNRGKLYGALCTLVAAWLHRVRWKEHGALILEDDKDDNSPVLASYEPWCRAVAEILDDAGIKGFLGNRDRVAIQTGAVADADDALPAFVEAWLGIGVAPTVTVPDRTGVKAKELVILADAVDLDLDVKRVPDGLGDTAFCPREFARWLGRSVGRIVAAGGERWRIVRSDPRAHGGATWSLEAVPVTAVEVEAPRRRGSLRRTKSQPARPLTPEQQAKAEERRRAGRGRASRYVV